MVEPMTPEQKLKHAILLRAVQMGDIALDAPVTADNVDQLYEEHGVDWQLQDARNEVRCSGEETGLPAPLSRHYESKSVAAKMPDGSWVGWTYWYGGGKHGEPEAIDWMDEAYDLACTEEQKLVTVRSFTKPTEAAA